MLQLTRRTPYSVKKINAKKAPEYSVLNPETSSDSDSEKSKGARCDSARVPNNQIGKIKKNNHPEEYPIDKTEKEQPNTTK